MTRQDKSVCIKANKISKSTFLSTLQKNIEEIDCVTYFADKVG